MKMSYAQFVSGFTRQRKEPNQIRNLDFLNSVTTTPTVGVTILE